MDDGIVLGNFLPKSIYKTMGPFGRTVTLPLMLVLTPLLLLPDAVLPFTAVLLLPLWALYAVLLLPLFLFVIAVERGIHRLGRIVLHRDIGWVRRRGGDDDEKEKRRHSSTAAAATNPTRRRRRGVWRRY